MPDLAKQRIRETDRMLAEFAKLPLAEQAEQQALQQAEMEADQALMAADPDLAPFIRFLADAGRYVEAFSLFDQTQRTWKLIRKFTAMTVTEDPSKKG
jgi:hypothetical protein